MSPSSPLPVAAEPLDIAEESRETKFVHSGAADGTRTPPCHVMIIALLFFFVTENSPFVVVCHPPVFLCWLVVRCHRWCPVTLSFPSTCHQVLLSSPSSSLCFFMNNYPPSNKQLISETGDPWSIEHPGRDSICLSTFCHRPVFKSTLSLLCLPSMHSSLPMSIHPSSFLVFTRPAC